MRSRVRARPSRGECCCHVYSSSAGLAVNSILFIFASALASSSLFVAGASELVVPSNNHNIEISTPAPNEFLLNPSTGGILSAGKSTLSSSTATAGAAAAGQHLIEDATCDVEQLEKANDSQLHVILVELMTTGFFRNFAVDLDQKCPLSGWDTKTKKNQNKEKDMMKKKMKNGNENNNSHGRDENKDDEKNHGNETKERTSISFLSNSVSNDEEQQCEGGLPDLDSDAELACSVELGGSSSIGGENNYWLHQGGDKKSELLSPVAGSHGISGSSSIVDNSRSGTATEKDHTDEVDAGKDDEFECTGGTEELDDDTEPLCSLAKDDDSTTKNLFGGSSSYSSSWDKKKSFESLALRSISQRLDDGSSWESESQHDTFAWKSVSDPVIENYDEPCAGENDGGPAASVVPETFWLDMCSQIRAGDGISMVNLRLNPERNTGYNGTHIWNAIYEENCLAVDGAAETPMCYEERVLYKLLSGLHASTTLSIAKNYYPPSKKKGRTAWESNPQYFIDKFADHPEHIRNLHFSYVVLLRALKKASPFLYNFEIKTGDILDDEMATILLRRLLDSTILRSCHDVFTAFDESLMFKERETAISLQESFKGVFHNVSSILDCVQCQQCKLHGKMAMLGYGTALKILFVPDNVIGMSLSRNEIVALINTIGKLSESVREVRELTNLYWSTHTRLEKSNDKAQLRTSVSGVDGVDVLDAAVGAVSSLASQGLIDEAVEAKLIQQAFQRHPELMVLSKHYGNDLRKFLSFLPTIDGTAVTTIGQDSGDPDAIVVGSGLAGLAATLHILDRGGRVTLIEKEHRMGGNSNKASSGINAQNTTKGDSIDMFRNDTIRSAGASAKSHLIQVLVENSEAAVLWLKERVGVDLSVLSQLGGHGHKRTHRPRSGMVGSEIIYNMQRAVKSYEKSGMVQILMDTRVSSLMRNDNGTVVGVEVVTTTTDGLNKTMSLTTPNVILATGGFASDRRRGSYLEKYRPELMRMPATAGEFSTGDGITLGTSVGAGLVDMEKVQVHPTGWVDPKDPFNPGKILAGELMRGVGGILINQDGNRYVS